MAYKLTAEQLETVWQMPPKSHYPDRSKPFDFARSEVIRFLMDELDINIDDAKRAFENLRRAKHILFDPTEKAWMGKRTFEATFGDSDKEAA